MTPCLSSCKSNLKIIQISLYIKFIKFIRIIDPLFPLPINNQIPQTIKMRQEQFIRFVQEICYLLKLSQPCSKTALQYFLKFKQYENHTYDQQILIAACIYLSVKIFEEQVRIRDILNMIYVLTSLYKLSQQRTHEQTESKGKIIEIIQDQGQNDKIQKKQNQLQKQNAKQNTGNIQEECSKNIQSQKQTDKNKKQEENPLEQYYQVVQQKYILLKNIQKLQNLHQMIQPHYSLSDYNQYKGKIIQAEQMLLRILGFNFTLASQNIKQLKRLLIVIHHMRIPPTMAETIFKVYNDIHYIDIKYWPEGIIYFSYLLVKAFLQQRENERLQKQRKPNQEGLELKQIQSQSSHHKISSKQLSEISRIKEFIHKMSDDQRWKELFCTQIEDLQHYAQKLTMFYSGINTD